MKTNTDIKKKFNGKVEEFKKFCIDNNIPVIIGAELPDSFFTAVSLDTFKICPEMHILLMVIKELREKKPLKEISQTIIEKVKAVEKIFYLIKGIS